jgi:hypothetical protein
MHRRLGAEPELRESNDAKVSDTVRRMGKRMAIAAIAAGVIGVAAYVLSQPKEGTVEWHKREYLDAMRWRWSDRLEVMWDRVTDKSNRRYRVFHPEDLKRRNAHQAALVRLGYLQERTFYLTNRSAGEVASSAAKAAEAIFSDERRYLLTLMIYGPEDTLPRFVPRVDRLRRVNLATFVSQLWGTNRGDPKR